jgi:hypothetical protein
VHINPLSNYKIDFVDEDSFCGACVEGKQHSNTFLERKQRALEPGAIMHADLCGPMECASLSGAKYFLCITCDFSISDGVFSQGKVRDVIEDRRSAEAGRESLWTTNEDFSVRWRDRV